MRDTATVADAVASVASTRMCSVADALDLMLVQVKDSPIDEIVIGARVPSGYRVEMIRDRCTALKVNFADRASAIEFYELAWTRLRLGT